VALLQYFGQMGPLLGTRLYPESDGPLYLKGMAVCSGFMCAVAGLALLLRTVLRKENERRRVESATDGEGGEDVELLAEGEGERIGERKEKTFYFML